VLDEQRLAISRLNLEILIYLRHMRDNVDNGGGGSVEIVSVEKIGK